MKRLSLILAGVAGLALLAFTTPALAADSAAGKEVTINGDAKCAHCALKITDHCQTVIQAEENGKTVTYFLADNDIAKGFHDNVCSASKKVVATGTVKEVNGKQELTLTKITLAK